MDLVINGKRIHMQSNKREIEQNTHQEKLNMDSQADDEDHTPETTISFASNHINLIVSILFMRFWL